jgi:hypothetical protein
MATAGMKDVCGCPQVQLIGKPNSPAKGGLAVKALVQG